MATLAELVDRVHAAPTGPQVIAAFDYDGTLIHGFSAKAFYEHRITHGEMGPIDLARTLLEARAGVDDDASFAAFLNRSLAAWAGRDEEEMAALGRRLFKDQIASQLHREAWRLVEAHRQMGHTLVLASSALRFQTEPMGDELGFDHVLNTAVEIVDGRLTGRVLGPPLWGTAKAGALTALAADLEADLDHAFAYSNGVEDVPFLEAVGYPAAVEPDPALRAAAEERAWPVLRCARPSGRPGLRDAARTAAFYGGFFSSVGPGLAVSVAQRSRTAGIDMGMGLGADLALALSGVRVEVIEGAEHLWSARPCLFLFNHTSKVDAILVMKLLRERFTGVAKAQVKSVPLFGPLFQLGGVAFIDRSDNTRAREALEPVVSKLRGGTSIVVSPEGTRSVTPRMGPFKKGPFHIAIQAGVPIVPMLFRGVDGVQWRGAQAVRPGRIEVRVLPPVDTSAWTTDTVAEHRDEVWRLMDEGLTHWPGEAVAPARLEAGR